MKRLLSFVVLIGAVTSATVLFSDRAFGAAAVSPLAVSIVPPIQFPSDEFSITGLRIGALWGRHRDIYGLDLGLVGNVTEQSFVGIGVSGLFNRTLGNTTAIFLQAAGILNWNSQKTDVYGLQIAGAMNMNEAQSKVVGLQAALLANLSSNTVIYGAQVGIYNRAQSVYGLQIGLVNFAKDLHGLQIGLINFNETGVFGVSPIINFGF